jgi:hypothetical protein
MSEDEIPPPLITDKAGAAQALGYSESSIDMLEASGMPTMPPANDGGPRRYNVTAIVAWILEQSRKKGPDFMENMKWLGSGGKEDDAPPAG